MMDRWRLASGLSACVLLIATCIGAIAEASSETAIERLWGKDITVREFLLAVRPQLLSEIPVDAWNIKVQWGVSGTTAEWIGATEVEEKAEDSVRSVGDIYVSHDNVFDVWGKTVDFGASSTVIWPPFMRMDMMSVFASLLEDGAIIDTVGDTDYDVWRVSVLDSHRVDGGARYKNMSYHYVDYPTGYSPPSAFVVLYSWEVWIDE